MAATATRRLSHCKPRVSGPPLLGFRPHELQLSCPGCAVSGRSKHSRGPGVLLGRLNAIGIVWESASTAFRDSFGIWSSWTSCFSEVKARLVFGWQVAIAALLQHHAGFAGFASVDPATTRRAAKQYTGEARVCLEWDVFIHHPNSSTEGRERPTLATASTTDCSHVLTLIGKATTRDFDFQGTRAPGLPVSALLGC